MTTLSEKLSESWHRRWGIAGWISTTDHKRIGLRYLYTGFVFLILAGIEALIIRTQLAGANLNVVTAEAYNQLFSMHGLTMMFLAATPVLSGFGNYFMPLMVGARDMAFPRLNAFGYWVFLGAGLFLNSAFLIGQAPNAGWFNYVPLSDATFSPGLNIEFYTLGIIFIGISNTTGAINFLVTAFKLRAPGMSLNRIPIFVWGEVAFALTIIFALPPLTVANLFLFLERRFGFHFFDVAAGGDPVLWQHLFWIFGHPEVYLVVLPAFGLVSAIVPTFTRQRMIGYTYIVLAEVGVALISFGVWVHHMFAVGLPDIALGFVSAASFMVVIPSAVQVFAWIGTSIAGRPKLGTPLLFVYGFIVLFVVGGLTGAMLGAVPFDQATTDTYFVVAHFHYVLAGGAVFPMFGGLYYWGPKMTGRIMSETWGKISFWLMFGGFNLAFFPMHIAGLLGQPRRTYTYDTGLGWDTPNLWSTIGSFILALGILITVINWFWSRRHGPVAGNDPWGGETLEWATTSPPPVYNFLTVPEIRSREPMWDQPELHDGYQSPEMGGRPLTGGHLTLATSSLDAAPQAKVHMPHDSIWPFLVVLAIVVFLYGIVFTAPMVVGVGVGGIFGSVIGWFFPRGETQEL
ncbi:MAG: cytochrome c oxidase subunit I [Acidimicrobiia bacterium]|nr:cytochrome c oxidase subunit I [Acidimicrobiia bacterium]